MCNHCDYWNNPKHPEEMFRYLWGTYWFNVPQAYALMEGQEPQEVATADLAGWVDYPPKPGSFDITKRHVLIEHLDHVNMNKPVLFACYPETMLKAEDLTGSVLLIDGSHRIARAVRDGHPTIKAFLLNQEQTNQILIDNSGRKKPKTRKPRKKKCKSMEDSSTD